MATREPITDLHTKTSDAAPGHDENRRHSPRFRHECHAEMSPWENNRAGTAFGVVVENFSTTGVGIRHTDRLKEGAQYLLEVPRPGGKAMATLLTVVRCDENVGGWFEVEMAPDEVLAVASPREIGVNNARGRSRRGSSLRLGLIFLAFAVSASAMLVLVF